MASSVKNGLSTGWLLMWCPPAGKGKGKVSKMFAPKILSILL